MDCSYIFQIRAALLKGPTMLDLRDELHIASELMSIDEMNTEELDCFFEIMEHLLISRSCSYYSITSSEQEFFSQFACWMKNINITTSAQKEEIDDLIRIYNTYPNSITR